MYMEKMARVIFLLFIIAVTVTSGNFNDIPDDNDVTQVDSDDVTTQECGGDVRTFPDNTKSYVDDVKQNFHNDVDKMLNEQINRELQASYIYQAYASFFQRADVNLPGVEKFFKDASAEEKQHAQMLIDIINKRGGHAMFDDINLLEACCAVKNMESTSSKTRMCICNFIASKAVVNRCPKRSDWREALYAFEDALYIERYVNSQLLLLHQEADAKKDAQLTHVLEHDFLDEQVKSIFQLAGYVTRLKSFPKNSYKLGEYLFDQKL